MFKILN